MSREEEVENVTGFIERDSNGVTLEVDNIGCYSEVLAYYNITRIPVRTSITNDTCPRPTTGKQLLFNLTPCDPLNTNFTPYYIPKLGYRLYLKPTIKNGY